MYAGVIVTVRRSAVARSLSESNGGSVRRPFVETLGLS